MSKVLCLTREEDQVLATKIENIAKLNAMTVMIVYNLGSMLELSVTQDFSALIIDGKNFSVGEEFLNIFRHKCHYIPKILIVDGNNRDFLSSHIIYLDNPSMEDLENVIVDALKYKDDAPVDISSKILLEDIKHILIDKLLILPRRKGFTYLCEFICRLMLRGSCLISFRKEIYPEMATYFNASEASVEKLIRDYAKKVLKIEGVKEKIRFQENEKVTTKNVVCRMVEYCQANIDN